MKADEIAGKKKRGLLTAYGAFASSGIRRLFFVGVPVLLLVVQAAGVIRLGVFLTPVILFALVLTGIAVDGQIFGGCCAGKTDRLDYLRTSTRGMGLLRKSLVADCVGRLAVYAAVLGVCFLSEIGAFQRSGSVGGMFGASPLFGWLWCLTTAYGVSMAAIGICRYFTLTGWIFVGAYVGTLLEACLLFAGAQMANSLTLIGKIIVTLVSFVLAAAATIWSVQNVVRKAKERVHDGEA